MTNATSVDVAQMKTRTLEDVKFASQELQRALRSVKNQSEKALESLAAGGLPITLSSGSFSIDTTVVTEASAKLNAMILSAQRLGASDEEIFSNIA